MNNVKCEVIKITAFGSYKSFVTIRFDKVDYTFYSTRGLYDYLKKLGVPTSQSLRKKK